MFEAQITKGAALLDATNPGWRSAIDVSTLDLESTYSCVLGQLYHGDYTQGTESLGIDGTRYGFDLPSSIRTRFGWGPEGDQARSDAFFGLTQEWIAVITDRAIRNDWLMDERDAILADLPHTD